MKKALKALWHGIKAVFTAIVNWMATLFGMKSDTKYGRVLRTIVGTAFAVVVVLWAVVQLLRFGDDMSWRFGSSSVFDDDDASFSEQLSDDIAYYDGYPGYLKNAKGKKVLKDIWAIAKPMEGDSLVWFNNDDGKRGYFHMRDGHLAVKPIYEHAWIFSEGLAAVEEDGKIKFINTAGEVVIDKNFVFDYDCDGYVFHRGHCAVNVGDGSRMGLIDHNGDWVMAPEYDEITQVDTFWVVCKGDEQAVLTFGMDTLFPMAKVQYEFCDSAFYLTFADHTRSMYSLQGQLLCANLIKDVELLQYDTRELIYPEPSDSEDYYYDDEPYPRKAVATCMRYEAESTWYGLMAPDGRLLTPPSYYCIQALGEDLYLCETSYGDGIILNSQGKRVQ